MVLMRKALGCLGLLAVLMTATAPGVAVCEMTAHPADGDCRTQVPGAEVLAGQGDAETQPAGDCCTSGCQDCALPCCARPALMMAKGPSLGDSAAALKALPTVDLRCPQVDAEPRFRPPQA
jgi:hypothetical protein